MENAIGAFLRDLRTCQQMSLGRLAARAGVAKSTLSKWEADQFQPRLLELEAVFCALNASHAQRERALALMNVPRALHRVRQDTQAAASHAYLGTLPTGGDLLRAMRHRHGMTLEQAAAVLSVAARTVSRWERTEDWPSIERLHALCRLLGAREEEIAVLTLGPVALASGDDNEPTSPDVIEERLKSLTYSPISPVQAALMDLTYLTLEAQAWRLALRSEAVRPLVAKLLAWHANQLWIEQRFVEAGHKANQAMIILSRLEKTPDFAFLATIRSARTAAEGGSRPAPARGTEMLELWLPRAAPWPEYHAWLLSEMALYASQAGQGENALAFAAQACQVAERARNPAELPSRRLDQVKVLLRCGRLDTALDRLQSEEGSFHPMDVSLLRAEALLASGNQTEAHDQLQRAYKLADAHAARDVNVFAHGRRQADALARRF